MRDLVHPFVFWCVLSGIIVYFQITNWIGASATAFGMVISVAWVFLEKRWEEDPIGFVAYSGFGTLFGGGIVALILLLQ